MRESRGSNNDNDNNNHDNNNNNNTDRNIHVTEYTRSPLEDSRFFGPSPWNILAATYEHNDFWATQPLAKILRAGILLWRPDVQTKRNYAFEKKPDNNNNNDTNNDNSNTDSNNHVTE